MTTLNYQVLVSNRVTHYGSYYLAQIPDLDCQAFGASPSEAVEASRAQALRKLQEEFEGTTRTPPQPSHLSLAVVDLPAPRPRRAGHLRSAPGIDDCRSQQPSHGPAAINAPRGRTSVTSGELIPSSRLALCDKLSKFGFTHIFRSSDSLPPDGDKPHMYAK